MYIALPLYIKFIVQLGSIILSCVTTLYVYKLVISVPPYRNNPGMTEGHGLGVVIIIIALKLLFMVFPSLHQRKKFVLKACKTSIPYGRTIVGQD